MKTAIMIPLYDKDLSLGKNFVTQYSKYYDVSNLYLIFSEKDEVTKFDCDYDVNKVVCTEKLNARPITQKKLWGVQHIFDNYQHNNVIVVDIDSFVIDSKDIDTLVNYRLDRKTVYASRSSNANIINRIGRDCATRFFNKEDVKKLEDITDGFSLYFWFNDMPVYERRHYFNFLEYINYDNTKSNLRPSTFDYIIYMYYLLVTDKWSLEEIKQAKVTSEGSFVETQLLQDKSVFRDQFREIKPMWIIDPINSNDMEDVWMKLHINR